MFIEQFALHFVAKTQLVFKWLCGCWWWWRRQWHHEMAPTLIRTHIQFHHRPQHPPAKRQTYTPVAMICSNGMSRDGPYKMTLLLRSVLISHRILDCASRS